MKKWNIFNDNLNSNYAAENKIIYNTEILKSNLCGYIDSYILSTGDITVVAASATQVALKYILIKYILNTYRKLMEQQ